MDKSKYDCLENVYRKAKDFCCIVDVAWMSFLGKSRLDGIRGEISWDTSSEYGTMSRSDEQYDWYAPASTCFYDSP